TTRPQSLFYFVILSGRPVWSRSFDKSSVRVKHPSRCGKNLSAKQKCDFLHARPSAGHSRRMLKKSGLLTHPTPAAISPARPESDKTASSSMDAPFRRQSRSELSRFKGWLR